MWFIIILSLFFLPAALYDAGFPDFYLTFKDILTICLCYLLFSTCPMRRWRRKIASSIFLSISIYAFIHNLIIDFRPDVEIGNAETSIIIIISASIVLYLLMLIRFDSLPNDQIKPGSIYEIIGKPRTDLQFMLFMITGGRGGSHSITDGVDCIRMSRTLGRSVKRPLSDIYLDNKKCIRIGPDDLHNRFIFNTKIDKKFYLWRTCHWLAKGFRNG